jgi:hypothetical protein
MATRLQPAALSAAILMVSAVGVASAQTDPGVRPGAINGQPAATATNPLPLASVTPNTPQGVLEFFEDGLGPRFNLNQCSVCHSQPTIGGTSPAHNPEFDVIANGTVSGATILERVDPVLTERRFNPIPVRVIIDANGKVKHIHFISAFPEQAKVITDALLQLAVQTLDCQRTTGRGGDRNPVRQRAAIRRARQPLDRRAATKP